VYVISERAWWIWDYYHIGVRLAYVIAQGDLDTWTSHLRKIAIILIITINNILKLQKPGLSPNIWFISDFFYTGQW